MYFESYLHRIEDLHMILRNGKRSNKVGDKEIKGLIYLPYRIVKIELPELINKGQLSEALEVISKEIGGSTRNMNNEDKLYLLCYVLHELKNIGNLEQEYLSSQMDPDVKKAGGDKLIQFGELNVIDALAGGDILKWEAVENMPYHKIFDKLYKNKIEADINKALSKMKKQ